MRNVFYIVKSAKVLYIIFMKIVVFIAPSKTLKKTKVRGVTSPLFPSKTALLTAEIKKLDRDSLKDKMHLSQKLTNEVYTYYHSPFKARAINLFSGVSYKAMDVDTFNVQNNDLYIVDAYYGLIRPQDDIETYRLDFTMNFLGNLYAYWKETIHQYISDNHKETLLIDLTSKEFSSLIPYTEYTYRLDFKAKNINLTSVTLKKMRGLFTRYIITHKLQNLDEIKQIKIEGFSYDPQSSSEHNIVFSL